MASEGKRYNPIKFDLDEFLGYCQEFYKQFGHLDITEKVIATKSGDGIEFIRRPTVEQNANKCYDLGAKFAKVRLAKTSGNLTQGRVRFNESLLDKLSSMDPDWLYCGSSEFNEFYYYCKIFKEQYGNLNVPLRCVAIKDSDGSIYFKSRDELTTAERERESFIIGKRILEFANRRGRLSNRNEFLINRQLARLKALDPYWDYPRDFIGNRIDPVTKKCVDNVKSRYKSFTMRKNVMFDFDEFYSYLLLYKTMYNSLNISSKCVFVVDDSDTKRFARIELAKEKNWEIKYRLGWFLKEITYYHNYPNKGGNSVKRLTDEQYQKLNELCVGFLDKDKSSLGTDYATLEWVDYCNKTGLKQAKTRNAVSARQKESAPRIRKKQVKQIEEESQEESASNVLNIPHELINFDFDLMYGLCKQQKDTTGSVLFSKAKVVSCTLENGRKIEYPIGLVFRSACETRFYLEQTKENPQIEGPRFFLKLTDEQNKQMDELDKFWFYPSQIQRKLRVQELRAKRETRKLDSEKALIAE